MPERRPLACHQGSVSRRRGIEAIGGVAVGVEARQVALMVEERKCGAKLAEDKWCGAASFARAPLEATRCVQKAAIVIVVVVQTT